MSAARSCLWRDWLWLSDCFASLACLQSHVFGFSCPNPDLQCFHQGHHPLEMTQLSWCEPLGGRLAKLCGATMSSCNLTSSNSCLHVKPASCWSWTSLLRYVHLLCLCATLQIKFSKVCESTIYTSYNVHIPRALCLAGSRETLRDCCKILCNCYFRGSKCNELRLTATWLQTSTWRSFNLSEGLARSFRPKLLPATLRCMKKTFV